MEYKANSIVSQQVKVSISTLDSPVKDDYSTPIDDTSPSVAKEESFDATQKMSTGNAATITSGPYWFQVSPNST